MVSTTEHEFVSPTLEAVNQHFVCRFHILFSVVRFEKGFSNARGHPKRTCIMEFKAKN